MQPIPESGPVNPEPPIESTAGNREIQIHCRPLRLIYIMALLLYSMLLTSVLREMPVLYMLGWTYLHGGLILVLLIPYAFLLMRPSMLRSAALAPIQLSDDRIILPRKIGQHNYDTVLFENIKGIDTRGKGKNRFHIIETNKRTYNLDLNFFESEQDFTTLPQIIIKNIELSPGGTEKLEKLNQRIDNRSRLFSSKPYYSGTIVAIIAGWFCIEWLLTGFSVYNLPGLGANSALLVARGEYYRLVSAGFLHAGVVHFTINVLELAILGYLIEGLLDGKRFLIIFLLTQVFGSSLCLLSGSVLSVGASSGLFGLMGTFAYLNYKHRDTLPVGLRLPLKFWLLIGIANIGLSILIAKIDILAHLGGFLLGILLGGVLDRNRKTLDEPLGNSEQELTLLRGARLGWLVVGLGLFVALINYADLEKRTRSNLFVMQEMMNRQVLNKAASRDFALNEFAWEIAIDRNVHPSILFLGEQAARLALQVKDDPEIRDTLATLLYRIGHISDAVELEETIFEQSDNGARVEFYASQLVRFLLANKGMAIRKDRLIVLSKEIIDTGGAAPFYFSIEAMARDLKNLNNSVIYAQVVQGETPQSFIRIQSNEDPEKIIAEINKSPAILRKGIVEILKVRPLSEIVDSKRKTVEVWRIRRDVKNLPYHNPKNFPPLRNGENLRLPEEVVPGDHLAVLLPKSRLLRGISFSERSLG